MSKLSNMSKKKKIILISVLSFVAAILITAAVIVGLLFRPANIPFREDLGFETVCYELPDDRDPTAHTGIENIGYMNWRLQHQNHWYSEAHVFVDNSTDDQNVSTYKQYYEGVLISTDISKSNLVNKAVQYCQVRGGDVVLFRNSKGGRSTFNAINTPWSTDKPDGHTISEYKVKKGLPPLEFSVYILNENTVKDCYDVIDNGDGTYTQTFVLNYASEPAENDATYWYKTEMAYKAGGMMKEDPQFSEVSITYTFDSTWQVLSSKTKEVYKTITGIGAISCTAEGTTEYTYGDEELSYNSEYENYYKNYLKDYETPEDEVIDAAYCLAEAFSGFLTEDTCLSLDLDVDGEEYSGIVQLNIPENDVRVDLGGIKVYMTVEDGEQYLYISYGNNVKAKIALSALTSSEPAVLAEDGGGENGDGEQGILDKLLAALGDEENFTIADDKLSATLTPSINLGELLGIDLDVTLNLNFKFNISEEKAVTVEYVKADGNILGSDFAAELRFSDTGVKALTESEKAEYVEIDVSGISSLASAEALKIELSFSGYGVEAEGEVIINLNNLQVKADLWLTFDGDTDAGIELSLIYADDTVYLTLGSNGAQPAMLKVNIEEAAETIAELTGDTSSKAEETDILQTVLDILQKIGTGNVINFLLADDGLSSMLSLEGTNGAVITLDGTALLEKLGVEFELGEVKASINGGTIGLSAFGLNVTLTGTKEFTFEADDYKDASDLMPIIRKLVGAISDKKLSVKGTLSLYIDGIQVVLDLKLLSVDWSDGLILDVNAVITAGDIVEPLRISYGNGTARASIGSIGIELGEGDIDELISIVLGMFTQNGDGKSVETARIIGDLIDSLGEETDLLSIISSLQIGSSENSLITISVGGFEISLIDETQADDGILGISAVYAGDDWSLTLSNAHISEYEAPEAPDYDIEYFDAQYIMSTVQEIAEYIKDNGLSLSGSVTVGDVTVTIDFGVSWQNGPAEVQAKITVSFDTFEKSIYFEYGSEKTALYYDNIAVVLNKENYDGFKKSIKALIDAITADDKKDETPEIPDVVEIISLLSEVVDDEGENGGFDIFSILSKLGFKKNENGNLEISIKEYKAELILNKNGSIGITVSKGTEEKPSAGASLGVGAYSAIKMPANCQEMDVAELIPLIDNVTEIITNKGLTVSGAISIEVGTTTAKLTLYGLSVGWADGLELQLDARLEVNKSKHDFYAKYVEKTGELKIIYGALDGGAGIDINIKEDAEGLESALLSIYDRIADLINNTVEGELVLPELGSLDELLDWIKTGINTVQGVAELAETVEGEDGEDGTSIADILNSLELNFKNGKFSAEVMGVTLMLFSADGGFNLSVQTAVVSFEIKDVRIVATETTDFGLEVAALNAQDIADILDYVAATVELFVKDTFKINLTGTVTTTDEAYANKDGVKYIIDAGIEYQQGASGYPVHFVPEGQTEEGETIAPDFWIAPDMYFHLYVNMEATLPEVDSVLFDIYIFDGNPTVDSNGKTTSTAFTSGDNELDIYMSISRISSNQANVNGVTGKSEPVKIYAPMNELMTVLSAGLALVDVGSISIDALPQLNGIITQIGSILDVMLVDRYFGNEKERFTSLGNGIIESALGSSLSDFINDLINSLAGEESDGNEELPEAGEAVAVTVSEEGFGRERFGVIDKLSVDRDGNTTTLSLTVGETTAKVSKEKYTYTTGDGEETVEHSGTRLTNLYVDKSELNDTDTLNDLNIDFAYSGVNRVTSLSGYMSIEGLDSLVKALIDSATHEIPEEERTEENPEKYSLNNSFFIDGEITLSALGMLNVTVYIDGLSVIIDENGDVQVNLSIHYSGVNAIVTLINGDTTVDLSVKNGMVYIKRVQTTKAGFLSNKKIDPITIYRAMPVDIFLEDIMEEMVFMFNFGDTIANAMRGGNSTSSDDKIKEDYGTQFGKFFNSFTFTENANKGTAQWKAVINGKGLSELSGISIGDITATFDAVKDSAGGYVVNGLGIGGSLFSVLSFNATLNWRNPQEDWNSFTNVNKEAAAAEVLANDPGATVRNALNNMTDEEIIEKLDWDRLASESGAGYIELIFNNSGVMTSTVRFKDVTINYNVKSGIEDDAGEIYVSTDTQYALVNTTTNSIYSVLNYPDTEDYTIEGYSLVWLDPVYEGNDTYSVCARYVKTELKVVYYSAFKFNSSRLSNWTDGYDSQVYERTELFLSHSYGRPETAYSADYNCVGWGYQKADGTWIVISDLRTIENLGYLDTIELHAIWFNFRIVTVGDATRTERTSGSIFKSYYYTFRINVDIVYEFETISSLKQQLTLSGVNYRVYLTFDDPAPQYYTEQEYNDATIGRHSGVLPCDHYSEKISPTDGSCYAEFKPAEMSRSNGAKEYTTWNVVASFNILIGNSVIMQVGESVNTYINGSFIFN